jgi:hypothetical protein
MKTFIVAAVASAFSLGAIAASHMEKGASAPMAKPAAAASAPMAKKAASAPMAKAKAKKAKKAASAPA